MHLPSCYEIIMSDNTLKFAKSPMTVEPKNVSIFSLGLYIITFTPSAFYTLHNTLNGRNSEIIRIAFHNQSVNTNRFSFFLSMV